MSLTSAPIEMNLWTSCTPTIRALRIVISRQPHRRHTPSTAFRHLLPNSARFSYATEEALFISAQLSSDAVSALRKLQALVYDILPSTTAVFSYAIASRKLSANEQFFVGAQTVVSLLQTTQIISCLLYTSPSPRDVHKSRMPSSA